MKYSIAYHLVHIFSEQATIPPSSSLWFRRQKNDPALWTPGTYELTPCSYQQRKMSEICSFLEFKVKDNLPTIFSIFQVSILTHFQSKYDYCLIQSVDLRNFTTAFLLTYAHVCPRGLDAARVYWLKFSHVRHPTMKIQLTVTSGWYNNEEESNYGKFPAVFLAKSCNREKAVFHF